METNKGISNFNDYPADIEYYEFIQFKKEGGKPSNSCKKSQEICYTKEQFLKFLKFELQFNQAKKSCPPKEYFRDPFFF